MRGRPTTTINLVIPPSSEWVTFIAHQPIRGSLDLRSLSARLDDYWQSLEITGAIVLTKLEWHTRPIVEEPILCRNELLLLNVVLRHRDGLLHADFPLLDFGTHQPDIPWSSDDERLTRPALEVLPCP